MAAIVASQQPERKQLGNFVTRGLACQFLMSIPQPPTSTPITHCIQSKSRDLDVDRSTTSIELPTLRVPSRRELINELKPTRSSQHTSIPPIQAFDGIADVGMIASAAATSMTPAMRRKEHAYFLAMCIPLFLAGWNELSSSRAIRDFNDVHPCSLPPCLSSASAGPLIPRMQEYYDVRQLFFDRSINI